MNSKFQEIVRMQLWTMLRRTKCTMREAMDWAVGGTMGSKTGGGNGGGFGKNRSVGLFFAGSLMLGMLISAYFFKAHITDEPTPEIWVGFNGVDSTDPDVQFLRSALQQKKVHGVVLFQRNVRSPQQLKKLISFLTNKNGYIPIAIDQEGGKVMRLKQGNGFQHAGKMLAASDYTDLKTIKALHQAAAQEMADVGITMVFGPVADLNVNPECPVIGKLKRSFSQDADRVIASCNAVLEAYQHYGLQGCLKHAPGHGSSLVDSHKGLTDITQTWTAQEYKPFVACFKAHPKAAIMMGHMMNRHLDDRFPASMSKKTIDAMNAEMRRAGITKTPFYIADGYEMKAVSDVYTPQEFLDFCGKAGIQAVLFYTLLSEYTTIASLEDFLKEKLNIHIKKHG